MPARRAGKCKPDLKQTITQVGLEYRLMTQFTSFVAVEEMVVTDGNQPRRIDVPVEVPAGVNRAMVDADQPMVSWIRRRLSNSVRRLDAEPVLVLCRERRWCAGSLRRHQTCQ